TPSTATDPTPATDPTDSIGQHPPGPYRPSAALERAIRARDLTCRFPGCRARARRCDVDHTIPYPQGPTCACNLASVCRFHHRLKHRAGWHLTQLGNGALRWRSPTGHTYTTHPADTDHPYQPPHTTTTTPTNPTTALTTAPPPHPDDDPEPPWAHAPVHAVA
ncbi:HNH endonuclease signature motif containing protein, partial [Aquipuribacter nitratireducens]